MGQAFANKVMNQKLKKNLYCLRSSGVHPIINPPLLSAEARDATGPSLSGGRSSSPGRRVSGLGGPELVRSMLLLQLRLSSSSYSEMMGWFHAALTATYWNEICIIFTQRGAAHEVMVDETKPNKINEFPEIAPLANTYPPTDRFRFQDMGMGLHLSWTRCLENIKDKPKEYPQQQRHDGSFSADWICMTCQTCQQFTQRWLQEETGR